MNNITTYKRYDLLHINNYMYAIDKQYKEDSLVIYGSNIYRVKNRNLWDISTNKWVCMPNQYAEILPFDRIIATTDPSLGLPLLPELVENYDELISKMWNKASNPNGFSHNSFIYAAKIILTELYKPTAVELEMFTPDDIDVMYGAEPVSTPKIENSYVKVKKWIYE